MPEYNYRNNETGEEWTETRQMSARLDGVDGVKVVQLVSRPSTLRRERAEGLSAHDKFQRDVLAPACETWRGSYDSDM